MDRMCNASSNRVLVYVYHDNGVPALECFFGSNLGPLGKCLTPGWCFWECLRRAPVPIKIAPHSVQTCCCSWLPRLPLTEPCSCGSMYHARSILVHAEIAYEHLCRVIRYHTPWQPATILFPPALIATRQAAPGLAVHLRSGDIIDILEPGQPQQTIGVQSGTLKNSIREHSGLYMACHPCRA